MSSDPKIIVQKFLQENGYPFEMLVAREFQKVGFDIQQSSYYLDLNTGTPREIDIVVTFQKEANKERFKVIFPIECKFAPTPWILFSTKGNSYPLCYTHNHNGGRWMNHLIVQPFFNEFFELTNISGYGLTAVTTVGEKDNQKDNAYLAVQKILSFLKSEREMKKFSNEDSYCIVVPIIALKGKLFEAHLNNANNIDCTELQQAQLSYQEDIQGTIPKIHIVTAEGLADYIKRVVLDCRRLFEAPYMDIEITNPSLSSFGL